MRRLLRFIRGWLQRRAVAHLDRSVSVAPQGAPQDTSALRSPQQTGATRGRWIGNLLPPP